MLLLLREETTTSNEPNGKLDDMAIDRTCTMFHAFVVAAVLLTFHPPAPAGAEIKKMSHLHQWVLAYYMSYDNNLDLYRTTILDALEKGTKGSELVVTVLVDSRERTGLKRYSITGQETSVETLPTDNSADTKVFSEYMEWVRTKYPSEHYAVIFLNHGGRLDQMCLDEWPGEGKPKAWLSAQSVATAMRDFSQKTQGSVELLFFQQCGRGSLENLYSFHSTASAVMASQQRVGAPNTYYEQTLKWLATANKASGMSLARQIMDSDRHYSSYVCVSGKALSEIPKRLETAIGTLLSNERKELRLPEGLSASFNYSDEQNFDLFEGLGSIFRINSLRREELHKFTEWVERDLILAHEVKKTETGTQNLSGLSLFVPGSRESWNRYRDYPIYRESSLRDLWESLYGEPGMKHKGELPGNP